MAKILILKYGNLLLAVIAFFVILLDVELCKTFTNISYSIIAAELFYLIDVYLPHRYKKKTFRKVIKHKLFLLVESLRLCREVVVKFDFNDINRKKYVERFSKCNLNEKCSIGQTTKLEYINLKKGQIASIISSLLLHSQYLELTEYEILVKILDSPFLKEEIIAIDYNVPDDLLANYNDNQMKMGESIYDNYEMSKKLINYENN